MAAYAALVSVMHIIDQLQHHPRPPISLHKQQAQYLTRNISFLQDFLEGYNSHVGYSNEADELESRIANAAYDAEELIEGLIIDRILAGSSEEISSIEFYQNLEKVMEEMDLIKKEVMQMKEKAGIQDQLQRLSLMPASSSISARNIKMVGFDEMLMKLLDMLTNGKPDRQTISITGMGGIGKTTLARNIYENQVVVHHFDILAWVAISQEYRREEILLQLVLCLKSGGSREILSEMSEDELGEMLYKSLTGRRYLVMIDNLWNVEVWDKLRKFFPNNKNQSRIMVTTRLANLALQIRGSYSLVMNFLDQNESWNLLCSILFGEEKYCPPELSYMGSEIARNCKGLPLSIAVIGGLLAKSERTLEYWGYIAKNLSSIVNLEDDERCLQILYASYYQLPVHLKPCFLYMRVFQEADRVIPASKLIKLWVAEGFLRPIDGKSLEEVAEEYLKELVDRNLILVHKWGSNGKIKLCKIHDLLRDLCSREADKHKFAGVIRRLNYRGSVIRCRICIRQFTSILDSLQNVSPARSLIWDSLGILSDHEQTWRGFEYYLKGFLESLNLRLLRVFEVVDLSYPFAQQEMKHICFENSILRLLTLRYISYPRIGHLYSIPSSIYRLWNLHTLIARATAAVAPPEIWKMPLLRHVEFHSISLPDPPHGGFVLRDLQTLFTITVQDCREKIVERIPNIKKLKICQGNLESCSVNHLNNLCCLHKLESLEIGFASFDIPSHLDLLSKLTFPHCLSKLTLYGTRLRWGDMTIKIGSLPFLQVLKLKWDSFVGPEWETLEGQFHSLKSLHIIDCGLVYWTTDNTHFPCLEHLQLVHLKELKEIPLAIGEIPTLQSIKLVACSTSAVVSAENILEDQQDNYGNFSLQLQVGDL